jgi:DNA-binding PadR family transcriptional regulator
MQIMEKELLLLGLLRRQDMHGYHLAEFIEHNLADCADLKKPTAYFLLEKMAEAGWVSYETSQAGNRPLRRVYHMTSAGEAAFQELMRKNLAGFSPLYFSDDVSLAFIQVLPADEVSVLLEQRRALILARKESLEAAPRHPGTAQWMVEHQLYHLACELNWLDALLEKIKNGQFDPVFESLKSIEKE